MRSAFFPIHLEGCAVPAVTEGCHTIFPGSQGRFETTYPLQFSGLFPAESYVELINDLNNHIEEARVREVTARADALKCSNLICCLSLLLPPGIGYLIWGIGCQVCFAGRCTKMGRELIDAGKATPAELQAFIVKNNPALMKKFGFALRWKEVVVGGSKTEHGSYHEEHRYGLQFVSTPGAKETHQQPPAGDMEAYYAAPSAPPGLIVMDKM